MSTFDWEKVGQEVVALAEAVDDERPEETVAAWPMIPYAWAMQVLENLWDHGWRIVPVIEPAATMTLDFREVLNSLDMWAGRRR